MPKRTRSLPPLVLLFGGALMEGALFVLFSFLLAIFTMGSEDPVLISGLMAIIALTLSGALGGGVISRLRGDGGTGLATLSSLLLSLIFILIGIISGGGHLELGAVLSYLLMIGAAAFSAYLIRPRKRHRHR